MPGSCWPWEGMVGMGNLCGDDGQKHVAQSCSPCLTRRKWMTTWWWSLFPAWSFSCVHWWWCFSFEVRRAGAGGMEPFRAEETLGGPGSRLIHSAESPFYHLSPSWSRRWQINRFSLRCYRLRVSSSWESYVLEKRKRGRFIYWTLTLTSPHAILSTRLTHSILFTALSGKYYYCYHVLGWKKPWLRPLLWLGLPQEESPEWSPVFSFVPSNKTS